MPKCTILVGVPGSGKSTWILNQEILDNRYVASTDAIIEQIAGGFNMTYDECFKDLIKFAEKLMWKELAAFAADGERIYVDRTNLTAKSRKKFIDFLKSYGYEFDCVVFETPETDEWARRLYRPGKTIPDHVLESMADNIEIPTMDEGFTHITFL